MEEVAVVSGDPEEEPVGEQQLRGGRTWRDSYDLLCAFKAGNGHCNVPREYAPDPKLGKWVKKVSSNDQLLALHMVRPYCI